LQVGATEQTYIICLSRSVTSLSNQSTGDLNWCPEGFDDEEADY
jgi:hypothetical protein